MTDTNQLPQLPPLHPGDSHMESVIEAAIQGHASTREAMRWLVRQIVPQPAQATQADVTDEQILSLDCVSIDSDEHGTSFWVDRSTVIKFARAILALRPVQVPMTDREIELIDGMIAVQLDHAQRCDAISNRAMAEKQKGWDMERVELLRRIKSIGIAAQVKKEDA